MKKKTMIALCTAMVMVGALLAACGSSKQTTEESGASEVVSEVSEASEAVSETSESGEGEVGMINPWSEAASAEEAAKGAGIDGFEIAEDLDLDLGENFSRTYQYMEGLAEATLEYPASMLVIRKGIDDGNGPAEGDVSGDYTEYAHTWTEDIDGTEVTCMGNQEGDSTKTIWSDGKYCYSIYAMGLGGEEDFGLSEERLTAVIAALK